MSVERGRSTPLRLNNLEATASTRLIFTDEASRWSKGSRRGFELLDVDAALEPGTAFGQKARW